MSRFKKLENLFLVIFTIILFFLALIIIAYFYGLKDASPVPITPKKTENQKQYNVPIGNSYFLGSSDPKVTFIEFADFSCSICKNLQPKLKTLFLKNAKNIKIVYKDFPVVSDNSYTLSLIARCAGEQGLFWETHDFLYENQGEIDINNLDAMITKLNISEKEFNTCLVSEKYLSDIKKDYALAKELEVKGTPTLFINGYKLAGDIPLDVLEKIIQDFIKQ